LEVFGQDLLLKLLLVLSGKWLGRDTDRIMSEGFGREERVVLGEAAVVKDEEEFDSPLQPL
jgi:hypothetical protein